MQSLAALNVIEEISKQKRGWRNPAHSAKTSFVAFRSNDLGNFVTFSDEAAFHHFFPQSSLSFDSTRLF